MRVDGQGWPAIIGAEPSRSSGESLVAARALVEVGACFKGAAITRSSVGVVPSPSLRLQLDITAGFLAAREASSGLSTRIRGLASDAVRPSQTAAENRERCALAARVLA